MKTLLPIATFPDVATIWLHTSPVKVSVRCTAFTSSLLPLAMMMDPGMVMVMVMMVVDKSTRSVLSADDEYQRLKSRWTYKRELGLLPRMRSLWSGWVRAVSTRVPTCLCLCTFALSAVITASS